MTYQRLLLCTLDAIPVHLQQCSDILQSIGLEDYCFTGGVLRDHFVGDPYNDIDVVVLLPDHDIWRDIQIKLDTVPIYREKFPYIKYFYFDRSVDSSLKKLNLTIDLIEIKHEINCYRLKFQFFSKPHNKSIVFDLNILKTDCFDFDIIPYDATINSLMLKTSTGELFGHACFFDDLERKKLVITAQNSFGLYISSIAHASIVKRRLKTYAIESAGHRYERIFMHVWNVVLSYTDILESLLIKIYNARTRSKCLNHKIC